MLKVTTLLCVMGLGFSGACKKVEGDKSDTAEAAAPQDNSLSEKKTVATPTTEEEAGEVSVQDLAGWLANKTVAVFDANSQETRQKYGVIPGAKLLSHYSDYPVSVLPIDKDAKLVYYCSNTHCGASHAAANRAIAAGYADVHVLPVGIMGWVDAGETVEKL